MPSHKAMPADELIKVRYEIIHNFTMTKTDLARFMNCGKKNAGKVWDEIMLDIEKDGKGNIGLGNRYILTQRVLDKLNITKSQITKDYERTNKKG